MQSAWPAIVRNGARFSTSQIITSPPRAGKPPAAASSLPSGENATARTSSASPGSVATTLPVPQSHSEKMKRFRCGAVGVRKANQAALLRGRDLQGLKIVSPIELVGLCQQAGCHRLNTSRGHRLLRPQFLFPMVIDPDRKSTRLNSSHLGISYAVFCLKK